MQDDLIDAYYVCIKKKRLVERVAKNVSTQIIIFRYSSSVCEMVMWSPSQTGGFPPGTPVSLPHEDQPNVNIGANKHD